ncbi:hypothetical protein ACX3X6_11725 [Pseudomonas sichuanensis]
MAEEGLALATMGIDVPDWNMPVTWSRARPLMSLERIMSLAISKAALSRCLRDGRQVFAEDLVAPIRSSAARAAHRWQASSHSLFRVSYSC